MSKFSIKNMAIVLSFLPFFGNNSLVKANEQNAQKILTREDYKNEKPEQALKCYGAKGTITWGNELSHFIRKPTDKNDILCWDGRNYTPVFAHCGWHQGEIIWKDSDGNYLVPTGIVQRGM